MNESVLKMMGESARNQTKASYHNVKVKWAFFENKKKLKNISMHVMFILNARSQTMEGIYGLFKG
jgi:hypothetical protein